jgi:hypothetical protein
MVSKTIDLGGGLRFESITAGKTHFGPMLKDGELGKHFVGREFQDIKRLYDAYCQKTNWIVRSPVTAFFPKNETGKGFTTKCFGIEFEDGSSGRFSLDKALSSVAGTV